MSVISLNGFITWPMGEKTPKHAKLDPYPLPSGVMPSKHALTLPYGFRNRLTESAKLRTYADQNSRRLQIIQLEVEVGTPLTQRVHRTKTQDSRQNTIPGLPEVKFIYFDKMVSDLEDEADRIIRNACEREDIEYFPPFNNPRWTHPRYIDFLKESDTFGHLDVIVFRVPDGIGDRKDLIQVANLYDTSKIVEMHALAAPDLKVDLPKLKPVVRHK